MVKDCLTKILECEGIDTLRVSGWRCLQHFRLLLKPFAEYTAIISGETYTTVSYVVPFIKDLELHLMEMKRVPELAEVSSVLLCELQRRFIKFTDPHHDDHEPLYLVSTLLDPRYKLCLTTEEEKYAQQECLKRMKLFHANRESEREDSGSAGSGGHNSSMECSPLSKRPRVKLSFMQKLMENKLSSSAKTVAPTTCQLQLQSYIDATRDVIKPQDLDPINFWMQEEYRYPLLTPVAVDILSIPASSAAVERVFSTAGESSSGKRNRLSKNLEREVFLRKNKDYYFE